MAIEESEERESPARRLTPGSGMVSDYTDIGLGKISIEGVGQRSGDRDIVAIGKRARETRADHGVNAGATKRLWCRAWGRWWE